MIGPLSYLDAALLAICFISGLLAMYRGLTRELLSILSWVVAAAATFYFVWFHHGLAADMAQQMGTQLRIAQIAVGALIFLIVLIIVHLITARVSDSVLDSQVGMIDRVLGFIYGVARGLLLIVIPYMFYDAFLVDPKKPETEWTWVNKSVSYPLIRDVGISIRSVLLNRLPPLPGFNSPNPPQPTGGEQQGLIIREDGTKLALAYQRTYHISVTSRQDWPA
jgi:membrane protein required for colicin V production